MRGGKRITTTQVPPAEFQSVFGNYLKEGKDIVYIGCSSALSGSVNTAAVIAKELKEQYPEREIYCVDTLNSCHGEAMIAMKAAEMKREGKSAEEVCGWIEENKLKFNQIAPVGDLTYLKRAGRVKASTAFFGNLLGVKPIIISDARGNNFAVKKVKGRRKSLEEAVNMVKDAITDTEGTVYVCHADCAEDAETVKNLLLESVKCKDVKIEYIGPIIGASTGPGTIGVYFFGKEVTEAGE